MRQNLCQPATQKRGLPVTGEYQRLELIRRLPEQTPKSLATLNELARRAVRVCEPAVQVSPCLRKNADESARDCCPRARVVSLMEGYSAAGRPMSGYQHTQTLRRISSLWLLARRAA